MPNMAASLLGHYGKEAIHDIDDELFVNTFIDFVCSVSGDNGVYGIGRSNDVFEMRMYDWNLELGEPSPPNFHYKPTDYKLWWYKYAGREMMANRDITHTELDNIIAQCEKSRKGNAETGQY